MITIPSKIKLLKPRLSPARRDDSSPRFLNGSVPNNTVGPSGSNSVEGRVPEIRPASMAEFHLATHALEQAHAEDNVYKSNLLSSIRHYISTCHKANPKTNVQRSSLNQWRAPEWAEKVKYDPQTGLMKPSGLTKEEDRNQRIQEDRDSSTKQARLLLSISNRLGLTVNGVPDSQLGNISSPRHEDHPLMWMAWCSKITRIHPKGITLNYTGYPYERVIRAFRRIAPFFKEKKKGNAKASPEELERRARQRRGQIITMGIIAVPQRYNELIRKGGLNVFPTPNWESIEFLQDIDEMECARHLASRGVTSDEVSDASQYAFTWLEHSDMSEKDTQTRILINTFREQARLRPESNPWPENLPYEYHPGFARWMPVLPAAGTTQVVVPTTSASIIGGTATLSLTGTGTSGLQPHNTAVPPTIAIVGPPAPTGDASTENVDMEEPCGEEENTPAMETDNH
jgi:hypothetical protein